ncbi:MAG: 2-amino-4-hydroxy-6-hydroxymethyldihydropteridine diphosphokinase [Prevotella sp.]|nr:2-amino-4-hydroxy-6-hydroxymethyldihydropteridine diphosphokinase [Prevotella sp.]
MDKTRQVILALGTNHEQELNMSQAKEMLSRLLDGIRFSSLAWTAPIGIVSDHFLNCLAIGGTSLSLPSLLSAIKRIERKCGDTTSLRQENIVCMDIDILMYGDKRMHQGDWQRPYIQQLMNELTANIQQP